MFLRGKDVLYFEDFEICHSFFHPIGMTAGLVAA